MNKIRSEILKRAEDVWEVRLVKSPQTIETKKLYRNYFNLELKQLKVWMQPKQILLQDCRLSEANDLKQHLSLFDIEIELLQTGINYRGKYSNKTILEALYNPNHGLDEYFVKQNGTFQFEGLYNLIEDHDLNIACLKYLLELGSPIKE